MFTTCIHCTTDLGRNEAFEAFPVGSRLAFDARQGRLWVVCRHCARWNLSPLEERWEAIEAMERRFTDSRLRVSTDNVGLARLREGVELIRIGAPQRPEMAAWRYGDQFGRRRRRQLLVTGVIVGSATAIIGGVMALGASVGSFAGVYANGGLWQTLIHGRQRKSIGKVHLPDGTLVDVQRRHARMSALQYASPDAPLQLRFEHVGGTSLLLGDDAMRVAARLMPTVNRFGGSASKVQDAVQLLETAGSPMGVLLNAQQQSGWRAGDKQWGGDTPTQGRDRRTMVQKLPGTLHSLSVEQRLAIEMAVHEESERRAMEGELQLLEQAWRDAEEVAKIADNMFTPAAIESRLDALRRER
ncbi:MAG TPA: hypothetical protein DGD08_07000 [Gemmatimonas aurantiaca]|uniref:Uncharacterized protein n=2 Tax=Gemmatimonas aurantiaca TaxID=173480 RepID=C1A7G4_GEMAT|nr:hypothetical protein [Gemmatimonas aurantiaca]BAH38174.1 hypothetical protein GAU_1132 [Gemmatimonas aurantiaca T-27]HCT56947.1 hypothetical protein [Gemmatimonas aurantiaca]